MPRGSRLLLVAIEGRWQGQNNILGDKCLGEGPRQRPSHVFPNHWMLISYELFWVQVIIIEDSSKDLTTLLNLWHSWWKSIWNTYGVGHNSKPFRNWKPNSLLFLCCIDWYKDDLFNYTFTGIIWGWEHAHLIGSRQLKFCCGIWQSIEQQDENQLIQLLWRGMPYCCLGNWVQS